MSNELLLHLALFKGNLLKNQSPNYFLCKLVEIIHWLELTPPLDPVPTLESIPALELIPLWNQFCQLLEPESELESQFFWIKLKIQTRAGSRPWIATSLAAIYSSSQTRTFAFATRTGDRQTKGQAHRHTNMTAHIGRKRRTQMSWTGRHLQLEIHIWVIFWLMV